MKIYCQLILAAALACFTSSVLAEALKYTYVSADYSAFSKEIDGFSEEFKGNRISFDLSVAVTPHAALIAGYSSASAEMNSSGTTADANFKSGSLGIIIHLPINDMIDFIVSVRFINGEIEADVNNSFFGSIDADGGSIAFGTRAMVTENIELNGFIHKTTIEDKSKFSVSLGSAYYVVESVSIDIGYSLSDDADSLSLGLTKYF